MASKSSIQSPLRRVCIRFHARPSAPAGLLSSAEVITSRQRAFDVAEIERWAKQQGSNAVVSTPGDKVSAEPIMQIDVDVMQATYNTILDHFDMDTKRLKPGNPTATKFEKVLMSDAWSGWSTHPSHSITSVT